MHSILLLLLLFLDIHSKCIVHVLLLLKKRKEGSILGTSYSICCDDSIYFFFFFGILLHFFLLLWGYKLRGAHPFCVARPKTLGKGKNRERRERKWRKKWKENWNRKGIRVNYKREQVFSGTRQTEYMHGYLGRFFALDKTWVLWTSSLSLFITSSIL